MTTDVWTELATPRLRRLWAVVGAMLIVGAIVTGPLQWSPICAALEPWSAQWLFLGCWLNPPPPPPDIAAGG